ncbi:MAG TPA: hypothetical protein VGV18_01900 [Verrucomicrobiae bacterium]|nr:hypothetical protein [Verrucomicrobiae bacterium]
MALVMIWFVRLCLKAIAKHWLACRHSIDPPGDLIFGSYMTLAAIGLIPSFVRSRVSCVLFVSSVIVMPLAIFAPLFLDAPWWDWYMLIAYLGVPCAIAFLLLNPQPTA